MRVFLVTATVLSFFTYGCDNGPDDGPANGLSLQVFSPRFAEAVLMAIHAPNRANVRRIMAPKGHVLGAGTLVDMSDPEQKYRDYEQFIREKLEHLQKDLAGRDFSWEHSTLVSARILTVNSKEQPANAARQRLYEHVMAGQRIEASELAPHLVPLVEDQRQEGYVFLLLRDGKREATILIETMLTKQGRRISMLSPRIEVQGVTLLDGGRETD